MSMRRGRTGLLLFCRSRLWGLGFWRKAGGGVSGNGERGGGKGEGVYDGMERRVILGWLFSFKERKREFLGMCPYERSTEEGGGILALDVAFYFFTSYMYKPEPDVYIYQNIPPN